MANLITAPFTGGGAFPVDARLEKSKAEMLATNDNVMPENYFALCDGQIYLYQKSNTVDPETGKYRLFEGGGGTDDYSALTNKPKLNGVTLDGEQTSEDFGLADASSVYTKDEVDALLDGKVFVATYNVTTAAEILAYMDAAKEPFAPILVKRGSDYYTAILAAKSGSTGAILRVIGSGSGDFIMFTYTITGSTWANSGYTFQKKLVSGTDIKTINGQDILGSGNLDVLPDMTQYYSKTETDALLDYKADKSDTYTKAETDALIPDVSDLATKTELTDGLALKADASTTYTKSETDTLLAQKADAADLDDFYTKAEVDALIPDVTDFVTDTELTEGLATKQDTLVSGTNLKTVDGQSLLGSGDVGFKTVNGTAISGSGNLLTGKVTADAESNSVSIYEGTDNSVQISKVDNDTLRVQGYGKDGRGQDKTLYDIILPSSASKQDKATIFSAGTDYPLSDMKASLAEGNVYIGESGVNHLVTHYQLDEGEETVYCFVDSGTQSRLTLVCHKWVSNSYDGRTEHDIIPTGGMPGQVLTKRTASIGDVEWANAADFTVDSSTESGGFFQASLSEPSGVVGTDKTVSFSNNPTMDGYVEMFVDKGGSTSSQDYGVYRKLALFPNYELCVENTGGNVVQTGSITIDNVQYGIFEFYYKTSALANAGVLTYSLATLLANYTIKDFIDATGITSNGIFIGNGRTDNNNRLIVQQFSKNSKNIQIRTYQDFSNQTATLKIIFIGNKN